MPRSFDQPPHRCSRLRLWKRGLVRAHAHKRGASVPSFGTAFIQGEARQRIAFLAGSCVTHTGVASTL